MKRKVGILVIVFILILGAGAYIERSRIKEFLHPTKQADVPEVSFEETKNTNTSTTNANRNSVISNANTNTSHANTNANTNTAKAIPVSYNLKVPFTTQAPNANWDATHEEACEEASAITVHYYYQEKTFTDAIAEKEIQDFIAYEMKTLGFFKDTTAQQTSDLIKSYWGYKRVDVITNPTADQIKAQIAAGRPIIAPFAGRQLNNPNFKAPGPLYHMLVIRGYTKTQFITNDVGTRKGNGYMYDISTIMSAMHDWNNGDVDHGQPVIIVVYPNN